MYTFTPTFDANRRVNGTMIVCSYRTNESRHIVGSPSKRCVAWFRSFGEAMQYWRLLSKVA